MTYKLSSVLRRHEMDVRGICKSVFPPGGLITVSRDRTIRVWKRDDQEEGTQFIEGQCFAGHEGFVAAVCTIPVSEKHPHGLIVTGGHDKRILVWSLESLNPLQTLKGHNGAVCALTTGNYGSILSGSWDKTAKVWLGDKCVMTLQGHEQAVWAVAWIAEEGTMLTGSADRTIKLWKTGICMATFSGHTDCVRSLAILSPTEFLSSSNDNTIRKWNTSGDCLRIYEGHTNFVYSLAVFQNCGENFVSTSEDRTLRVWKDSECVQTITLPAQSVWCSVCLDNEDIAVGSSDGAVRVFTCARERMASDDVLKQFEEEVSSHAIPAQVSSDGKLGDIKISDLPGPEALLRPGRSDGQNLLVKRGQTIEAHQWNHAQGKWEKVGEVVGAGGTSDGASQKSGKAMYNGKEYDYVFDVSIQEGTPPLKLPYNLTEDPWFAAQQFLERNDLSQQFLDQVANFITQNTKSISIGPQNQSGYVDPFTGASRYVPGSATSHQVSDAPRPGADPFTGEASYRPSYASTRAETSTSMGQSGASTSISYFPEKSCLSFDQVKIDGLIGRVNEINSKVNEEKRLSNEDISEMKTVLSVATDKTKTTTNPLSEKQIRTLTTLIYWPLDICYPGLDILRVVIRKPEMSKHFIDNGEEIIKHLVQILSTEEELANHDITTGIIFRIFSNLFSHGRGVNIMLEQSDLVLQCIKDHCKNPNKIAQIAVCTVLINFAVVLKNRNDSEAKVPLLNTLRLVMTGLVDTEAKFRALVALGTMIWGDQDSLSYAKVLEFTTLVQPLSSITEPDKVGKCARQLTEALL